MSSNSHLSCDPCENPIGDHWAIVFAAYALVFFPWTIIQSIDFIGPEWKSVRETRSDGRVHLAWTFFPIIIIIVFIVLQLLAEDYKEAAVAIAALIIGLRHLINTLWGLWQLEHFRQWAADSITTLKRLGIEFRLEHGHPEDDDQLSERQRHHLIADCIKVNESVVDNQILYGAVTCYCVKNDKTRMNMKRFKDKSFLAIFTDACISIQAIWLTLGSIFRNRKKSVTDPNVWHQRPKRPVHVWINWAAAFTSQGCKKWLEDFDVEDDPPPVDPKSTSLDPYYKAQNFYARDLLSTLLLLLPKDDHERPKDVTDPLEWLIQAAKTSTSLSKSGKVSKVELFQQAVKSGKGLPFSAPQKDDPSSPTSLSIGLKRLGYQNYAYILSVATGAVCAEFGDHANRLTMNALEWLTILLSLGPLEDFSAPSHEKTSKGWFYVCFSRIFQRGENRSQDIENPPSTNFSSSDAEEPHQQGLRSQQSNTANSCLTNRDIAVVNLRIQLGVEKSMPRIIYAQSDAGLEFSNLSFPCRQLVTPNLFPGNENLLQVSAMLDLWRSLQLADSIKEVLRKDGDWEQATRSFPLGPSATPSEKINRSKQLYHANSTLQKISLMRDFTLSSRRDLESDRKFDQTIGIIGAVIERVRSRLAGHVQSTSAQLGPGSHYSNPIDWSPSVSFVRSRRDEETADPVMSFELTSTLSKVLFNNRGPPTRNEEDGINRIEELRLLAEIQKACIGIIEENRCSLDSELAILTLITGFPALYFEMESHTSTTLLVKIMPCCAPQRIYISLTITVNGTNTKADLYLASRSENVFDWSAWRDALGGRLRGLHEWRMNHGIETGDFLSCNWELSAEMLPARLDNEEDSRLFVWLGWFPFTPIICEFERRSYNSMREPAKSRLTTKQLTSLASSVVIKAHQLRHKRHKHGYAARDGLNQFLIGVMNNDLVKDGEDLLKAGKGWNFLALDKFEVAAQRGSLVGFQRFMENVTNQTTSNMVMNRTVSLFDNFYKQISIRESILQPQSSSLIPTIFEKYVLMVSEFGYNPKVVLSYYRNWRDARVLEIKAKPGSIHRPLLPDISFLSNTLRKAYCIVPNKDIFIAMSELVAFCASIQNTSPYGWFESSPSQSWGAWLIRRNSSSSSKIPLFVRLSVCLKSAKDWEWSQHIPQLAIVEERMDNSWDEQANTFKSRVLTNSLLPTFCTQETLQRLAHLVKCWCGFTTNENVDVFFTGEFLGMYESFNRIITTLSDDESFLSVSSSLVRFAIRTIEKWRSSPETVVSIFHGRNLFCEIGDLSISNGICQLSSSIPDPVNSYILEICKSEDRSRFNRAYDRLRRIGTFVPSDPFRQAIIRELTSVIVRNEIQRYRFEVLSLLGEMLCRQPISISVWSRFYLNFISTEFTTWIPNLSLGLRKNIFNSFIQLLECEENEQRRQRLMDEEQLLLIEKLKIEIFVPSMSPGELAELTCNVLQDQGQLDDLSIFGTVRSVLFSDRLDDQNLHIVICRLEECVAGRSFYATTLLAEKRMSGTPTMGDVISGITLLQSVIERRSTYSHWPDNMVTVLCGYLDSSNDPEIIQTACNALHIAAKKEEETEARLALADFYVNGPPSFRNIDKCLQVVREPFSNAYVQSKEKLFIRQKLFSLVGTYFNRTTTVPYADLMDVFTCLCHRDSRRELELSFTLGEAFLHHSPTGRLKELMTAAEIFSSAPLSEKCAFQLLDLFRCYENSFQELRAYIISTLGEAAQRSNPHAFGILCEIAGDVMRQLQMAMPTSEFGHSTEDGINRKLLEDLENITKKLCQYASRLPSFHDFACSRLVSIYCWIHKFTKLESCLINSSAWFEENGLLRKIEKVLSRPEFPDLDNVAIRALQGTFRFQRSSGIIHFLGKCAITEPTGNIFASPPTGRKRSVQLLLDMFSQCRDDVIEDVSFRHRIRQNILHMLIHAGRSDNLYAALGIGCIFGKLEFCGSSDTDLGINALGYALRGGLWKAAEEIAGMILKVKDDQRVIEQEIARVQYSEVIFRDDQLDILEKRLERYVKRKKRLFDLLSLRGCNNAIHEAHAMIIMKNTYEYDEYLKAINHIIDGIEKAYWPSIRTLEEILKHQNFLNTPAWKQDELKIFKRLAQNLGYLPVSTDTQRFPLYLQDIVQQNGHFHRNRNDANAVPVINVDRARMSVLLALGCLIRNGRYVSSFQCLGEIINRITQDGDLMKNETCLVHQYYAVARTLWNVTENNLIQVGIRKDAAETLARWSNDNYAAGQEFYGTLLAFGNDMQGKNLELAAWHYRNLLRIDEVTLPVQAKRVFVQEKCFQAMETVAEQALIDEHLANQLRHRVERIKETYLDRMYELDDQEVDSYLAARF